MGDMDVKIWHDDVRYPPDGWQWARDNKTFVLMCLMAAVQGIAVTECSLDHDLGEEPGNIGRMGSSPDGDGVDLVKALCALRIVPPKVTIHSWNQDGALYMAGLLASLTNADIRIRPYEIKPGHCLLCGRSKEVCGDCLARAED
jgi:hypothetical protein